jgi:glutathione synthase/RimK-type ligase-like ATP-grasp enzyme
MIMKFLFIDIAKRLGNKDEPQYAVQRLAEELQKRSISYDLGHYDDIVISVEHGVFDITFKGTVLKDYSHIIIRGHRTPYEYMLKQYIVAYADLHKIVVQNAEFIKKWPQYNKTLQMQYFTDAGLPYIDSAYSIDGLYWEKKDILKRIGFPLIYKHIEGEYKIEIIDGKEKFKKNVYLIKNVKELENACHSYDKIEERFTTQPSKYFIQKYIDSGIDYRAIMIGGAYFSGWKREATQNFLTVSKGEYTLYDKPEPALKDLAIKTAQLLSADYCAVDIIYNKAAPYILEVNMNPSFKAFETKVEGQHEDIAAAIIDQIINKK